MDGTIREVLRTKGSDVQGVPPHTPVFHAVERMNRMRIGSLLVMDERRIHGMFSERDVLIRVITADRNPREVSVGEVMTKSLSTASLDDRVTDVLSLMTRRRIRHVPVIANARLAGLVSLGDLTKWITDSLRREVEDLSTYITSPYALNPHSQIAGSGDLVG
jgi:CBS domain-containing protein